MLLVSICLLSYFVFKPVQFYALATLVGLVMGGIQSLFALYLIQLIYQILRTHTLFFSASMMLTEKIRHRNRDGLFYGIIDQANE